MLDRLLDAKLSEMDELLNSYVKEGHSVSYLLNNFSLFNIEKKKIIIERFYKFWHYNFNEIITSNEDIVLMIDYLTRYGYSSYDYFKKMTEPKKYLEKKVIDDIIEPIGSEILIRGFGDYFKDEIIETKFDCYELLKIKEKLSKEEIIKIYKKTFSDCNYIFDEYLSFNEKMEYTKVFLSENSDMYSVAEFLIKERAYDKEDFNKLILLIGAFAPASSIYNVLMKEKLSDSQKLMLEKSLYDTKDIEYIAYYTFYKNKKEFNRLFGNVLLFLGFVKLNKELFKNDEIINDIIESAEAKNEKYVDSVVSKIQTTYKIKPKNGVKPNK